MSESDLTIVDSNMQVQIHAEITCSSRISAIDTHCRQVELRNYQQDWIAALAAAAAAAACDSGNNNSSDTVFNILSTTLWLLGVCPGLL
jgi:hypothetical protein